MTRKRQTGATLIVSLMMLVILTLFAMSAINSSSVNLQIVGNMQILKKVEDAAQNAIEDGISSIATINIAIANPNAPASILPPVNGVNVTLSTPQCTGSAPATDYSALSKIVPEDSVWELSAAASDPNSGAAVVIHQGVKVRLTAGSCT